MARSAPLARASRSTCWARAGPEVMATTSPPCFSFWRSASSNAKASGSLTSYETSSRIQVLLSLSLSGASFCGTCFMQTRIFKNDPHPRLHVATGKLASINEGIGKSELWTGHKARPELLLAPDSALTPNGCLIKARDDNYRMGTESTP